MRKEEGVGVEQAPDRGPAAGQCARHEILRSPNVPAQDWHPTSAPDAAVRAGLALFAVPTEPKTSEAVALTFANYSAGRLAAAREG
jgi:hypothetical protein